jgi:hypothetical protein
MNESRRGTVLRPRSAGAVDARCARPRTNADLAHHLSMCLSFFVPNAQTEVTKLTIWRVRPRSVDYGIRILLP